MDILTAAPLTPALSQREREKSGFDITDPNESAEIPGGACLSPDRWVEK